MNVENLIKILQKEQVLEGLEGKRSATGVLPITTNIRLLIAEIALEKSRSAILGTAIATYLNRNEATHHLEIEALAAIAGVSAEEYVAQVIKQKLGGNDGEDITT